jgi:hypothetical protein
VVPATEPRRHRPGASSAWRAGPDGCQAGGVDWDRNAPMSMGNRLAMLAELVVAFTAVIVAVGLAARWSDTVASIILG